MERNQLLVEVKSIIVHAICTMRTGQSTQSQRDDALDNLASAMFAIETCLVQGTIDCSAFGNEPCPLLDVFDAMIKPKSTVCYIAERMQIRRTLNVKQPFDVKQSAKSIDRRIKAFIAQRDFDNASLYQVVYAALMEVSHD